MTGQSDRLRALCISPAFLPIPGSRTLVAAKLIKALVEGGLEPTVLYDGGRLGGPDRPREASACFDSIRHLGVSVTWPEGYRWPRTFASAARWRAMGGFAPWVGAAIRKALELHAQKPFDFVYSFSVPTWAHIAGYWVARKTKLPWALDISDPWDIHQWPAGSQPPMAWWRRVAADYWERRSMACADLVTYCSERLAESTHRFVTPPKHWVVLPHIGYANPAVSESGDVFNLVHTGSFTYGRTARELLMGLHLFLKENPEAREKTKLTLVGPGDTREVNRLAGELGILSQLTLVNQVSYEKSLDYIGAATACVLVEARFVEGIFLPSKVVDYIAAHKPIVALSPATGMLNDMSVDPGILRVSPDDVKGVAGALRLLWQDFRDGTLDRRRPSPELVAKFTAASVAKRFFDALPEAGIVRRER